MTIRDVAAEAGWSSGALRHYLPTREELLVFAFQLAGERAAERIRAAGDAPVGELLEQALPLDDERRQEAAHLVRLRRDRADRPEAGRRARARPTTTSSAGSGSASATVRQAAALFAAVDGIAIQALAMPGLMTPARQRATLRLHLNAILGS